MPNKWTQAVGNPVGRCLGGQLATTLEDCYFYHSCCFPIFSPSQPFLIEWLQKLAGASQNLRLDPLPDPSGHFGFCRQCVVAGNEQVPLFPPGWYLIQILGNETIYMD